VLFRCQQLCQHHINPSFSVVIHFG
jgi:hypothetical protein